jgi:NAD(P)-dependent dehydrogenase (short-subunit alcohol dehydrogenase family)
MSGFQNRVAAVTGAGSGIGRALALGLARRGARLALSDVDEGGLAETARAVAGVGAQVHTARLDVGDREAVHAYADAVAAHFGAVNQVYNNAGIAFSRPVLDSEYADYERVFAVNLWGVIHGTKAFLPHLIASGEGHVTNISSLNGYMAQGDMSHYCATKFAVRGFTETLRIEMLEAGHPVRVTVVHPGGVRTSIATNALNEARRLGLEVTATDVERERTYNEKLLKMPPEVAAETILEGVARDRARVLVGNDARVVDLIVRALPSGYPRVLAAATKRLLPTGR